MLERIAPTAIMAVLALAVGAAPAAVLGDRGTQARRGTDSKVIGGAVSNGFRVLVTAARVPGLEGEPDAATVRIAAYERSGGEWDRLGAPIHEPRRARSERNPNARGPPRR